MISATKRRNTWYKNGLRMVHEHDIHTSSSETIEEYLMWVSTRVSITIIVYRERFKKYKYSIRFDNIKQQQQQQLVKRL